MIRPTRIYRLAVPLAAGIFSGVTAPAQLLISSLRFCSSLRRPAHCRDLSRGIARETELTH
jgi:hypothetical protein